MPDSTPSSNSIAPLWAVIIRTPSAKDLLGKSFELKEGEHVFGRSGIPGVIDLDDRSISRRHIRIVVERGMARLEDLGSMNGTRVNDELVSRRTLRDGDEILLATSTLLKITHVAPRDP